MFEDMKSKRVSKSQFEEQGKVWPLTIPKAVLLVKKASYSGGAICLIDPEQPKILYAVNGIAMTIPKTVNLNGIWKKIYINDDEYHRETLEYLIREGEALLNDEMEKG